MSKITAQVEIKSLGKTITMDFKGSDDLEDCPEDSIIVLNFSNGDNYTGKLAGYKLGKHFQIVSP